MFTWKIELSAHCLLFLQATRDWNDDLGQDNTEKHHKHFGKFSHFITHTRVLEVNGLIKRVGPSGARGYWVVTPKGNHLLSIVEIDAKQMIEPKPRLAVVRGRKVGKR